MNKKTVITLMSVVCMAVFCFPVSAAQQYPHKSGSVSGDVAVYYTIEYRGLYERLPETDDSISVVGFLFHISYTLRNTSTKIQVANTTNFRMTVQGFKYMDGSTNRCMYHSLEIMNPLNCDVNDLNYNNASSNTTNEFYMNMFPTFSLVLEPEDKVAFSFDVFLPIWNSAAYSPPLTDQHYQSILANTTWSSSVWNFTDNPTFTGFTVEEYANQKEGFWPYLIRVLQKLVQGNQDSYEEVEDGANALAGSANDSSDDLNNIHAQEEQWYNANSSAIEATGLSNYHWSTGQALGLNAVVGQFSQVWSALGDWTLVYTFTLILSLATFILRHRPSTKMQQRMKLRDAATESQIIKNQVSTDYYSFKFNDAIDQRNERLAKSPNSDNVSGQSLIDLAIRRRNRK